MKEQLRRIMGMVTRGVIETVDASRKFQTAQVAGLADEIDDDVEMFEQYGLTSRPKAGAEAVMVRVGGVRSHGIIIAFGDRRFRLKDLAEGEVALYDDQGQVIHLKRDSILIKSATKVRIEAPTVEVEADSATITADTVNLGGTGGEKVARIGDSVANGVITSGSDKVKAV